MKKLTLIVVISVLAFNYIGAQNNSASNIDSAETRQPYSEFISEMIEKLDKSFITTGLLLDKAYILSSMNEFNGLNDTAIMTVSKFRQIYRQLYNSSIVKGALFSPDSINIVVQKHSKNNKMPIIILNLKYNEIKAFAVDSNLLLLKNGKLFDVPGRNRSPYNKKRLFTISIPNEQIYQGKVDFVIDSSLIFINSKDIIKSIEINFDDGTGFTKIFDKDTFLKNTAAVSYNNTGKKVLTCKVTLFDNTILQSRFSFVVESISTVTPDDEFDIQGYLPFNGSYGTGTAYVLYGCKSSDHKIHRPIIFSDGFDPENTKHFPELYSIANQENNLVKLRLEGYDIIILDYDDGGTFIQRNAFVLVSLINEINMQLTTNGSYSKHIIFGPSMAGLITRYALTFMEKTNLNHNTKLFVAFDSPNLGATIPLGDQCWLEFFATYAQSDAAIRAIAALNTPAAKQMLVYHFTQLPSATNHPLRTNILNDPYFGYPFGCRKVAIANGSGNNTLFFNPCNQLINWVYTVAGIDFVIGNVWAVPEGGSCNIFKGRFTYTWNGIPYKVVNKTTGITGSKPYDNASGGSFNTNEVIASGDTQGHGDITTDYPYHCFIPTVSSLSLNGADLHYNVFNNFPTYPYVSGSNITPFDVIFAPTYNQEHVEITAETIEWLKSEVYPFDLYLQNQILNSNNEDLLARMTITCGKNVDPIPNRTPIGNFVANPGSCFNIRAGQKITLASGTYLKSGSKVHICFQNPCIIDLKNEKSMVNTIDKPDNDPDFFLPETWETFKTSNNAIFQNYPNPCYDMTHIHYIINEPSNVEIILYDLFGKQLKIIEKKYFSMEGQYETILNVSSMQSGTYFCILKQNGSFKASLKIFVSK
jgi:hypothetical protein